MATCYIDLPSMTQQFGRGPGVVNTFGRRAQGKYEYACHEGNYAMGNILRGARILEGEYTGPIAAQAEE